MRYCLLAALLVFALMTSAVGEEKTSSAEKGAVVGIPEFSADYELRRNNTRAARLTRTLECEDGECRFSSEGRTVGFADLLLRGRISEYTRFRFDGEAIEPRDYSYRQRARGDNNEYVRLFFHPRTGRVSSRGDEDWQATVDGEAMDELLSQLRLLLAVRAGETEMEFTVVEGGGDLDAYRFEVVGEERIETDAGTYDTVKVKRVRGSAKRITEMWFAPELEYIPLVVRHERVDRESYTATLVELKEEPRVYMPGE
ncbi:DUF3108 domain-containing protein [Aquisalimonas sp.]|uniref:DUF3108 domain-containing protein n=1 Tax=Aquisalimonas sp. TaxID=1872621 RepID=UPI0025BFA95C|nr:DUF3108 domain-containing protein [Aquisalimonas sp.]